MKNYDPSISPDPEQWFELDEQERIELAFQFVENFETEVNEEAHKVHATIHAIIENQLAENVEPTLETYKRLIRQGLNRHETIHALGAVIFEDIIAVMESKTHQPLGKHKLRLRKLTAKRWRKGKY